MFRRQERYGFSRRLTAIACAEGKRIRCPIVEERILAVAQGQAEETRGGGGDASLRQGDQPVRQRVPRLGIDSLSTTRSFIGNFIFHFLLPFTAGTSVVDCVQDANVASPDRFRTWKRLALRRAEPRLAGNEHDEAALRDGWRERLCRELRLTLGHAPPPEGEWEDRECAGASTRTAASGGASWRQAGPGWSGQARTSWSLPGQSRAEGRPAGPSRARGQLWTTFWSRAANRQQTAAGWKSSVPAARDATMPDCDRTERTPATTTLAAAARASTPNFAARSRRTERKGSRDWSAPASSPRPALKRKSPQRVPRGRLPGATGNEKGLERLHLLPVRSRLRKHPPRMEGGNGTCLILARHPLERT